jgi:hypothetical protein
MQDRGVRATCCYCPQPAKVNLHNQNFGYYLWPVAPGAWQRGALKFRAEIIPNEPDAGNAAEGIGRVKRTQGCIPR